MTTYFYAKVAPFTEMAGRLVQTHFAQQGNVSISPARTAWIGGHGSEP